MLVGTAGCAAPAAGKFRSLCCGYLVSVPRGECLPRCRWCDGAVEWRFEGAWKALHVQTNDPAISPGGV